jgi:hypothetical protein
MKKKREPLTHRHLKDLLPLFLEDVQIRYEEKPERILKGWREVIDVKWQAMTEACSFEKGTIVIKVKNATLYSLLVQQEGSRLLKKLQEKFPESSIKKLKFCIG